MIDNVKAALGILALVLASAASAQNTLADPAAAQPLKVSLGTNARSAFSSNGRSLGGELMRQMNCVFSQLPYEADVRILPWRRAQQDVSREALAGFFTAMPDAEVDRFATLSAPLVLESWYWFWRAGRDFKGAPEGYKTGAILGSHQELWFQLNGIHPKVSAQDLPQLLKLLRAERIDLVLADRAHFDSAARELGMDPDNYRSRFFSYVPLGVYFGHHFLEQHAGFIDVFNQQIPSCVTQQFALSPSEQRAILAVLPAADDWAQDTELLQLIQEQNRRHEAVTPEKIQRLDSLWRDYLSRTQMRELNAMLDARAGEKLVQWEEEVEWITEIIVVDVVGLNVAAAPLTSDFWQGDEAKYQQAITLPEGQWFFDEVVYDSSTRRFQVQVSRPLYAADRLNPIGVMTLGVDVQKILKAEAVY